MFSGIAEQTERNRRDRTARTFAAWWLCALLLLLSVSSRLSRYEVRQRALKLATTQAYLEGPETLRQLSKAARLVFWQVAVIASFAIAALYAVLLVKLDPRPIRFIGLDPERYLRPPPTR